MSTIPSPLHVTARPRSQGIDALRALFALWVLFAHVLPWADYYARQTVVPTWLQSLFNGLKLAFQSGGETHPAVLGFIVLSGYCVHRSRLRGLVAFAVRRGFRIYPVYLLAIGCGIAAYLYTQQLTPLVVGGTTSIEPGCVGARALALAAVYPPLFRCSFLGNAPLNTVMAEIWLYAAYPVLLLGVSARFGERQMWMVIGGIWLLGVAAITAVPSLRHWWNVASLPGFLLYWWIGAAATSMSFTDNVRERLIVVFAAWSLLTLCFVWFGWTTPILTEVRKIMFALAVTVVIAAAERSRRQWTVLSAIGVAGYSLYALHAPLAHVLLVWGWSWWITLGSAVLVGLASYWVFERPLLRVGERWSRALSATPQKPGLPVSGT